MTNHYIRKCGSYFMGGHLKKVVYSSLDFDQTRTFILDTETGSDVDMHVNTSLYKLLLTENKVKKHTEINKWEI